MEFRDLAYGQTFDFVSDSLPPADDVTFLRLTKITPRKYIHEKSGKEYHIGSVRTPVHHPGFDPRLLE